MEIPAPLQRLMGDMMRDIQQSAMKRAEQDAKSDPARFRLSRIFPAGVDNNYRYYDGGKNGRGSHVRFCYSVNRNIGGYFLTWRETITAKHVKRDMWSASRSKKVIKNRALDRMKKFKAK